MDYDGICNLVEKCWQDLDEEVKLTMEVGGEKLSWINEEKIKYRMGKLIQEIKLLKNE